MELHRLGKAAADKPIAVPISSHSRLVQPYAHSTGVMRAQRWASGSARQRDRLVISAAQRVRSPTAPPQPGMRRGQQRLQLPTRA